MMNQRYHVVFKKGKVTVRRPWKKGEELYSSSGNPEKGVPAMFGGHEERQFLENLGPFAIASIDSGSEEFASIARQILDEGYTIEDPDTHVLSKWYVAGYYVRDDGAVYIMTPEPTKDVEFFKRLGLRVDLENKWGNSFKVGKYMKRLYSHHRRFIQGEVVSKTDGSVILVRLPNKRVISVRYADYGKLTDGMNLVSTHCMKMLGLKRNVGQGLRITALSPKGFSKGHAIVLPDLRHDLVLFNSKKMLYGDQFTLGVDWLHSGALFTDVQSVVNFRMYNTPFLNEWAEVFMNQVIDALQDEEKLRKMLHFYNVDFHKNQVGEEAGEYIQKEKDWALLRALRGGVSHKTHPALVRKIFHLFADKVMNCETNIRIPVPQEVGGARYAIVDPTIFDVNGDPTLEGSLSGNTVYCPDHVGDVVFHRQPNAHRGEHHIATSVPHKELQALDNGCFMFMSRDMVVESLGKLGGGDQDDRLVYYKKQEVVDHFKALQDDPYPLVTFPEQPKQEERKNTFAQRILRKPTYDRTQLLIMLEQQKKQGVSIGYAVNAIIHDTVLTDCKQDLLNNMLANLPMTELKNKSAHEWLKNRQDNALRDVTSRLEIVIDAVKKEGSDINDIGDAIKKFNNTFEVVADFCTKGGKFDGRIPTSRRGENHPVISRCKMDDVLDSIKEMRKDLEDIVTDISWQMLAPVPLEVLTYPTVDGSEQLAVAIQSFYRQQRAMADGKIKPTGDKIEKKARINSYVDIDKAVYNRFKDNPMVVDAMIELYIKVYENRAPEAPRDAAGKAKAFPDGILWGPCLSGLTIKALEYCGLAGRFEDAAIDDEFKKAKREVLDVQIEQGLIKDIRAQEVIGTIDPMADGIKVMEKGLVFVPAKDAYPYEPALKLMSLTVVNGMDERGASISEVAEWRSHSHEQVTLEPYIYVNTDGDDEHAVRVLLNGEKYGNITRKDATHITRATEGWLAPGNSPKTMCVIVKA